MASLQDTKHTLLTSNDEDNDNTDTVQPNSSSHSDNDPSTIVQEQSDLVITGNKTTEGHSHNHSDDVNNHDTGSDAVIDSNLDTDPDAKPITNPDPNLGNDCKEGSNKSKVKSKRKPPSSLKPSRKKALPFSMKEILALPADDLRSVAENNPKQLAAELRKAYNDLNNPTLLPKPPGKRGRTPAKSRLIKVVWGWRFKLYDPSESLRVRLGLDPPFQCSSARTTLLWREKRHRRRRRRELGCNDANVDGKRQEKNTNGETTRPSKALRLSISDNPHSNGTDSAQLVKISENIEVLEPGEIAENIEKSSESCALPRSQGLPGRRDNAVTSHRVGAVVTFQWPLPSHGEKASR